MARVIWSNDRSACQLVFDDPELLRVTFDYAAFLHFHEGFVAIESRFLAKAPAEEGISFDRATMVNSENVALLRLVGQRIEKAEIRVGGDLELTFEDGTLITIPADPEYVSWSVEIVNQEAIIGAIGGALEHIEF